MIPKIIHLCWLSGDPFPVDIVKCLETWNDKLQGYTIWLWGKAPRDLSVIKDLKVEVKNFDLNSTIWTRQAFEAKKYAFAADYIRLYALYNFGGIYLDADVVMYKPFDDLLVLPYFIGADRIGSFEAAVIGCEKGNQWVGDILCRYDERNFILPDGRHDMYPLPGVFRDTLISKGYMFKKLANINSFVEFANNNIIYVFKSDFFNSRDHIRVRPTKNSYCAHNYLGTWCKNSNLSILDKIKKNIPNYILNCLIEFSHITWNRHKYDNVKIPFAK